MLRLLSCLALLFLHGCKSITFQPQTSRPSLPPAIHEILQLSGGKWLTDPSTGKETIHTQAIAFSDKTIHVMKRMILKVTGSEYKRKRISRVFLGETDAPHLYQLLDTNIVFSNNGMHGIYINVRVAFTLREQDALAGLKDFHGLRASGKEWKMGEKYHFKLDDVPLSLFSNGEVDYLSSLRYFFDRYVYKDFRILGLRIRMIMRMFTMKVSPTEDKGFNEEYHFYVPNIN